jgi:arylsulfatase A-like enzyme
MRGSLQRRGPGLLVYGLALLAAFGCSAPKDSVDVLGSPRARMAEAAVNGRGAGWVGAEAGRPRRIRDVVHASLPATPPSRVTFVADVPRAARLALAAGIPGRHHLKPAVEFVVSVRHKGSETTVLSRLVDPANRAVDRGWIPLEADLSAYAGRGVEIVLETRGFEATRDEDRAFWGTPTITTVADRNAPLVIVYLVDTLRADHLGLYGYGRDTAPELGRFARDAVVFDAAIASSSWTKPSVASLFTSLSAARHRCVQFYTPLDPSLVTLAERMRDSGYVTGAVVANRLVHAKDGRFDQGFAFFASPPEPQRAEQAVDEALRFLDVRQGLPTFLYVHTLDPHSPYSPPRPFDRRYGPAPTPGRPAAEPYDYRRPDDLARIVAQYDGEIAYGDQQFGRLLHELKARGLYDQAMIVFLSDHGEEFLDHGGWVHGHTLYDELVRVPLVVKYPKGLHAGQRVAHQVQLVDVLPTILKSQGLAVPEATAIDGRPLEESFAPDAPERPAALETKYRQFVAYGVRTRVAKYVRRLYPRPREQYFDLARDPRELGPGAALGAPARALRRVAESTVTPAAFRHRLRVEGDEDYELRVRTGGWIDSVEAPGLGAGERAVSLNGGREVALSLKPRAGLPREVMITTRPHGVPVWISGTRSGRPLRPGDIRMAAEGVAAKAVPFLVPDAEDVHGLFSPPRAGAGGVALWFEPSVGGEAPAFDTEARQRLKALGYLRWTSRRASRCRARGRRRRSVSRPRGAAGPRPEARSRPSSDR